MPAARKTKEKEPKASSGPTFDVPETVTRGVQFTVTGTGYDPEHGAVVVVADNTSSTLADASVDAVGTLTFYYTQFAPGDVTFTVEQDGNTVATGVTVVE